MATEMCSDRYAKSNVADRNYSRPECYALRKRRQTFCRTTVLTVTQNPRF